MSPIRATLASSGLEKPQQGEHDVGEAKTQPAYPHKPGDSEDNFAAASPAIAESFRLCL